jgi:ABC-type nitrate/sulfonate/bicarbonate transport system substrate-binding protein
LAAHNTPIKRYTALSLIGAGLSTAALPRAARAAVPLRIATLPIDASALAFYAQDLGYFNDAGFDVSIQSIANGATITSAIASGSLDIGWSNIVSLAAAYKHGIPVVIIGAGGVYTRGSLTNQLMIRKDSPIRTAADLSGKTIGCTGLSNIGQFAPELWIDKNGGASSSVRFIEFPLPELPAALDQRRIDAAWLAEPFITQASSIAKPLANCFDDVAPRWMLGAWFTTPAWVAAHRDIVDTFRTIMAKTATWANTNQAQSGQILAKYAHLDPALLKNMRRITYGTRANAVEIQPVIDLSARYGALAATFPAQELLLS